MGLGFSPLPYRLQLNRRAPSTVQPESNTIVVVSFSLIDTVNRKLENSSRRQQQSVPPLVGRPRDETMELSASNSRENVSLLAATTPPKRRMLVTAFATRKTCEFAELAGIPIRQTICFQYVENGYHIAAISCGES
jgi:hypothetical protein